MASRVNVQTDCERADTYPYYRALSAFTYWEVGLRVRYFYSLEHPLFTRKMILAKFRYISNTHRPDAWTYITGRTRVPSAKGQTPYMQILQIYKMSRA